MRLSSLTVLGLIGLLSACAQPQPPQHEAVAPPTQPAVVMLPPPPPPPEPPAAPPQPSYRTGMPTLTSAHGKGLVVWGVPEGSALKGFKPTPEVTEACKSPRWPLLELGLERRPNNLWHLAGLGCASEAEIHDYVEKYLRERSEGRQVFQPPTTH